MMNPKRTTRSMRKTRNFFHYLATSSLKLRKVSRQPKSPIKKPRSPSKIMVMASTAFLSTPVKAPTRKASSVFSFQSPMLSVPKLDEVSANYILNDLFLPQVTTATSKDGFLLKSKRAFQTYTQVSGARVFASRTVDVEIVQDDVSGGFYCLTKWHRTYGLGLFELDGPCSLAEAQAVYAETIEARNNPDKFPMITLKPSIKNEKPLDARRRLVRGLFSAAADGKHSVFTTEITTL
ncbi:hypothetical protein AC1031_017545 [Aphanomyces cochlioides]|nr:hypothetical protein AC1031_017545 [Aphanomyces cochlioides]